MSLLDKKTARQYDEASTQINVPPEVAAEITRIGKELIPDELLAGDGRVEVLHVTIKYGVQPDERVLRRVMGGYKSFNVMLGKTTVFPEASGEGTPVVIEVHGHEFEALHKAVAAAMGTLPDDFPYTPHITVAYVAQKEAQHFAGRDNFVGIEFVADAVTLSMFDDDNQVEVPLAKAAAKAKPAKILDELAAIHDEIKFDPRRVKNPENPRAFEYWLKEEREKLQRICDGLASFKPKLRGRAKEMLQEAVNVLHLADTILYESGKLGETESSLESALMYLHEALYETAELIGHRLKFKVGSWLFRAQAASPAQVTPEIPDVAPQVPQEQPEEEEVQRDEPATQPEKGKRPKKRKPKLLQPKQPKKETPRKPPTQTTNFKRWFSKSKVRDDDGKPLVVFHGTTHDFQVFDPSKTNVENYYGKALYFTSSKTDVGENYATDVGPDITSRIENAADRIFQDMEQEWDDEHPGEDFPPYSSDEHEELREKAKAMAREQIAGQSKGMTMPVYLSIQNPVVVQKNGGTGFELEIDDDGNESGSGVDLYNAMMRVAGNYYGGDVQEMWSTLIGNSGESFNAWDFEKEVRETENGIVALAVFMASGSFIADVYQEMGFDGIIQDAYSEFGTPRFGRPMTMDYDTKHYIVWDPHKVKSAIGNVGKFDPKDPSITAAVKTWWHVSSVTNRASIQAEGLKAVESGKTAAITLSEVHLHGRCHIFALALHRALGCDIEIFWDEDPFWDEDEDVSYESREGRPAAVAHVFGVLNGKVLDASGQTTRERIEEEFPNNDPFFEEVSEDQLLQLISNGILDKPKRGEVERLVKVILKDPKFAKIPTTKSAAPLHDSAKSRKFYHGTDREELALKIMQEGIQPREITMPDKAKSRAQLAPVPDRVYLTDSFGYAAIYALGGNMFGTGSRLLSEKNLDFLKGKDPFGYVFEIDGSTLQGDVVPDEDSIGEWMSFMVGYEDALKKFKDWEAQYKARKPLNDYEKEQSLRYRMEGIPYHDQAINKPGAEAEEARAHFRWMFSYFLTDKQKWAMLYNPDIGILATVGKKLQKRMTPEVTEFMLDNGAHAAHRGAVHPAKAWKIDKEKAIVLGGAQSNWATEVPIPKTAAYDEEENFDDEPQQWDRFLTLQPGTTLYHGTSAEWEEGGELSFPAWFSTNPKVADWFAHRNYDAQDPLDTGLPSIRTYRVKSPIQLVELNGKADMQEFFEMHGIEDYGIETISEGTINAGFEGWIIPDNYRPGDDIMLGDGSKIEYMETHPAGPKTGSLEAKLAVGEKSVGDLGLAKRVMHELMPVLGVQLPEPELKIVNSPRSGFLGQDVWRVGVTNATLYGNETTIIQLQRSILKDETTLRRIIAHELCHHADNLVNGKKLIEKYQGTGERGWRMVMNELRQTGHGKGWKEFTLKYNAKYGADFVNEKSDESLVVEKLPVKPYYIALHKRTDGSIVFASASRLGPQALKHLWYKRSHPDETERFTTTDDQLFVRGAGIGNGWAVPNADAKDMQERLQELWDKAGSEPPIELPNPWVKETKKGPVPNADILTKYLEKEGKEIMVKPSEHKDFSGWVDVWSRYKTAAAPQLEDLEQAVSNSRSTALPQIQELPHGVTKDYDRVRWVYQQFYDNGIQSMSWQDFQKKFPRERNSPLFTKVRQNRPAITLEDMDRWMEEYNAQAEKGYSNYELEHGTYRDPKTSFRDVEQLVLRVNQSASAAEIIGEDPLIAEFIGMVQQGAQHYRHPVSKNTVGWLRVDFVDDNWLLVDEVQSDLVNAVAKAKQMLTAPNLQSYINSFPDALKERAKEELKNHGINEQRFQMSKQQVTQRGYTIEKLEEIKQQLIGLFEDWAEYALASVIEIARRHGIKNVAINTGENLAARDPLVEEKSNIYYDQLAKSFGFKKQQLDVGDLKGNFWVRTASAKTAGKRSEAVTSMAVGTTDPDFPMPILIRWEQGMRWRQVLKSVKVIVGVVAGRRVPWREIHVFKSFWDNQQEQQDGWEQEKAKGSRIMYDILHNGSFVSVGKQVATAAGTESEPEYIGNCTEDEIVAQYFGDATRLAQAVENGEKRSDTEIFDPTSGLLIKYDPKTDVHSFYKTADSHKVTPLDETYYNSPESGEETNAYADIPERVRGIYGVPPLKELAPQLFEKDAGTAPEGVEYSVSVLDSHGGELFCQATATLDGELIGVVDFNESEKDVDFEDTRYYKEKKDEYDGREWERIADIPKEIWVKHVFVDPEYRRRGIATGMYEKIKQEFPGEKFTTSGTTREGTPFREKLVERGVIARKSALLQKSAVFAEAQNEVRHTDHEAVGLTKTLKSDPFSEEIKTLHESLGEEEPEPNPVPDSGFGSRIEGQPQAKGEDQLQMNKMEKASVTGKAAKFEGDPRDTVMGQVYLLHFDIKPGTKVKPEREDASEPFHARHYLGWALNAQKRIQQHYEGSGAKITQALRRKGMTFTVARIWDGADRNFERKLKSQGGLSRWCPICHGLGLVPKSRRRAPAMEAVEAVPKEMRFGPDYVEKQAGQKFPPFEQWMKLHPKFEIDESLTKKYGVTREELEERYWENTQWLSALDLPLEIYRALEVERGQEIDLGSAGVHWTWVENSADAYFGGSSMWARTPKPKNPELVILKAVVSNPSDIDFEKTLSNNIQNPDENEITLVPGTTLKLVGIDRDGEGYKVPRGGQRTITAASLDDVAQAVREIYEKFPVNPRNPDERMMMAQGKPAVYFELDISGPASIAKGDLRGRLRLKGIRSAVPGQGMGTLVLKRILSVADKHSVEVELTASPFGNEATRLDKDALQAWYRKHRFEDEPGYDPALGYMVRQPKSAAGAVDIDWKNDMFENYKLVPEYSWHEAGDPTDEDEEIGESNWNLLVVNAFDTKKKQKGLPGKPVGSADFVLRGGRLESSDTEVDKNYWRQGIATALYQYAEGLTGFQIKPHMTQSPAGRALWQQKNRPFGVN